MDFLMPSLLTFAVLAGAFFRCRCRLLGGRLRSTELELGYAQDKAIWHFERLRERARRVAELEKAIRLHRDERGDDRCHADDGRLYAVLPEGDTRPERETAVTIENCQKFIDCRQTGREYVSPQRRIEELEAQLDELQGKLVGMAERIFQQSELLSRGAEKT